MKPLEVTTPTDTGVRIVRIFDAHRELVWDSYTRPELVKRWLTGPPGHSLPVCEIDLRTGGRLRYVWRAPDGNDMGMSGEFREVAPSERLVHTEVFDQFADMGPGSIVTTEFAEEDGRTRVTMTIEYDSKETRDMVLATDMAEGVGAGYANLDELLAEL